MPAAVTLVRSTYTDADSFNAAAFNALTASSASVLDATPGNAGVMPATTTAAGLALTNAIDAAAQRTVLGLVIGTNVQAYDAELAAIAGLTGAADRLPYFTGPGAAALATFTSYGRTLAALVDAAAGRTALGLVIGTDVQAYDADLAAIAALATTSYGRSFLPLADAAAGRTLLGLGSMATQAASAVAITGGTLSGMTSYVGGSGSFTTLSGTLTSCTGLPISTGVSGLGTGVATALAVNVGSAGAPVVNGGALGTPSSGTVTNLTGTASININGTVGATTPSTGAFTTLSASGKFTAGSGTFSAGDGSIYVGGASGLTLIGKAGSTNDVTVAAANGQNLLINPTGTSNVVIGNGSGTISAANSVAVTGALSATGVASFLGLKAQKATATSGFISAIDEGANVYNVLGSRNNADNAYLPMVIRGTTVTLGATSDIATISSTGLAVTGALSCTGALSKGSGSFRIQHPLPEKSATHQLVHSFIEGPQADLIYRGKVVLVDGKASVNIDTAATMTEGTFEVLCRDVQCFTTNETGWTAVRGKITGNILIIEAKDADCVDEIAWMVIGERKDPHIMDTDWTDENGRPIVEPLKPAEPALESK